MFSCCGGLEFERSKEVWDNSFSHGQSVGQRHQLVLPVELETLPAPHFSTLGQDESSSLSLSWGPPAEPRPDVSVIQRGEQRQLTCPSLWSTCEKQWDLFVHRINLFQRGKHYFFFIIIILNHNNLSGILDIRWTKG